MKKKVHVELLDYSFELSGAPQRVVSLVSSASEAMDRMGMIDRVVGVSEYCERYIPDLNAPVVGQYLNCDLEQLKALQPDLILITSGIQLKLGRKLAKEGLPVYVLPLPHSFFGMLENNRILGGVLDELEKSRILSAEMLAQAQRLQAANRGTRPKIYVELWLGRHMRAVGGMTFIQDLVEMAGGDLLFGNRAEGYFTPDFEEVARMRPDIHLFFHEPEYLVDPAALVAERGWNASTPVIVSTVDCGRNMIQEGPSFLQTVEWLQKEIVAC
ncbi:ABC transporter substrate-binding protein [Verrucomicrobiaceae bacterium N1E253]|uniref:ABC transporter substrate-binding protein n=1 Tax=Oceaniferula marina TaxID=2748318 RepID=A0A851GI55_9BACT|nr:helical backbone metal receptor [Oceaniferula marina]NWK56879.1 ABC transporter substrate-binding protein [Oceaniferula marina]